MIDIHSHILYGVDDGADTLADAVKIARGLASQGVTDVVLTPHYVDETCYSVCREDNLKRFDELKSALATEGVDINIYIGNELYISEDILDWLKQGIISTLNDSKYLLVELPLNGEYQSYDDILMLLTRHGYQVILAHPERYEIFKDDYSLLQNLCEVGKLLQCNIGSFVGKYGKDALKLARKLAKDKMIFAFGSDVHHPFKNDYILKAQKKLAKYYSDTEIKEVLVENPAKILEK